MVPKTRGGRTSKRVLLLFGLKPVFSMLESSSQKRTSIVDPKNRRNQPFLELLIDDVCTTCVYNFQAFSSIRVLIEDSHASEIGSGAFDHQDIDQTAFHLSTLGAFSIRVSVT
jgi:hypothetical protein